MWMRAVLLCEDRAHLDLLRGICSRFGWQIVFEHVAPRGRGAASGWVLKQLPGLLTEVRSGTCTQIGLLVAVDGDNEGRSGRMAALAAICGEEGVAVLAGEDPVSLLVPTWSIDTWAVFFCKHRVISEDQKAKRTARSLFSPPHPGFTAPGVPTEDAPRCWKARALQQLTDGFLSGESTPALPSLEESRSDLWRWRG